MPVHLVTGFLGAGKTTLLGRVLASTNERIAIVVNEVADLPIDDRLLAAAGADVRALASGCVCCVLRGELRASLLQVAALRPHRIVLEASGLGDPGPVLTALATDDALRAAVHLAGVIAVVDCERGAWLLEREPEALRQLEFADRVVLGRCDAAPERIGPVEELLARVAPGRPTLRSGALHEALDLAWLFGDGFGATGSRDLRAWCAAPPPAAVHGAFSTHSLRHAAPVDVEALQLWLCLVAQLDGEQLLRVKIVARSRICGALFVLQSANRSVSPPRRLETSSGAPSSSASSSSCSSGSEMLGAEIVLIERGLGDAALRELLHSLELALAEPGA